MVLGHTIENSFVHKHSKYTKTTNIDVENLRKTIGMFMVVSMNNSQLNARANGSI